MKKKQKNINKENKNKIKEENKKRKQEIIKYINYYEMNFGQLFFSDYTKKEIQTESEIYNEKIFFENNNFQSIKE